MKTKIITDSYDLLLGFRLGGIDGKFIDDNEDLSKVFKEFTSEDDVAIIIFSKSCFEKIEDEVEYFRKKNSIPLMVVID